MGSGGGSGGGPRRCAAMMEFFNQGGYAVFVWGSYGMALALLVGEVVGLRRQRRTNLARLGRLFRLTAGGGKR
jgi:heme exporter protein D